MIKITKARRSGIFGSLFLLPLFLVFAGWAGFSGSWWVAVGILGVWIFFFLFATSYLFQALVVLLASIIAFSQKYWLAGIGGLFLTVYLYYASKLTDKDVANFFPERTNNNLSTLGNIFDVVNSPRKNLLLISIIVIISLVVIGLIIVWLVK